MFGECAHGGGHASVLKFGDARLCTRKVVADMFPVPSLYLPCTFPVPRKVVADMFKGDDSPGWAAELFACEPRQNRSSHHSCFVSCTPPSLHCMCTPCTAHRPLPDDSTHIADLCLTLPLDSPRWFRFMHERSGPPEAQPGGRQRKR